MLLYLIKLKLFQKLFRLRNRHNYARIKGICDLDHVQVGRKTYGLIDVTDSSPQGTRLVIGSYCSIAPGVAFLLGGEHQLRSVSTYPFKVMSFGEEREAGSKGDIVVGDDVWIGAGAVICGGVKVGRGGVIAAGAVVTKDVEPYAVVGGNPARFIKWRLAEPLRRRLQEVDLAALFDTFTADDAPEVYEDLTEDLLDKFMEKLK